MSIPTPTSSRKRTLTIKDAAEAYIKLVSINSVHTEKSYTTGLNHHFLTFLKSVELNDKSPVTSLEMDFIPGFITWLSRDYRCEMTGQPLHDSSRALYTTVVSGFYRHLIARGLLPGTLMSDLDSMQEVIRHSIKHERGPIKKRLPEKEIVEAFLEAARQKPGPTDTDEEAPDKKQQRTMLIWQRNLALVLSLHSSGMRVGEVVSLRRGDLDYATQGAYITGKGKHERFIRFSADAWKAIQIYLTARQDGDLTQALATHPVFCRHDKPASRKRLPMTTRSVSRIFVELATIAGILDKFHLTPHSLRHFFATTFLRKTGDLALTQDALGHQDPNTTRIYASTEVDDLITAHKSIFDGANDGAGGETDA